MLSDDIKKIAKEVKGYAEYTTEQITKIVNNLKKTLNEFKADFKKMPKPKSSEEKEGYEMAKKFYINKIKMLTKDLEYWESILEARKTKEKK